MAIRYEAYTRLGERVEGVLQTASEEDAYSLLGNEQLIAHRLRRVRPRRSLVGLAPGLFRPKPQDIIDFTRQLASLLDSGITLHRALVAQRDQTRSLGLRHALNGIVEEIEGGSRVSDAFSRRSRVFPELYLRLLRVGEATGGLPLALRQLTENLQRRKVVTDRVRRALMYPAISLVVAFVAAFVLVTYSLPALTSLLKEFGGELPYATQLLITVSDGLATYALFVAGPLVGFVALSVLLWRTASGKRLRDRVLLVVPVVGRILSGTAVFYLTSTLSTLLKAGVPPIEALKVAGEGLSNTVYRDAVDDVTRRASEGQKLGQAFGEQRRFPSILAQAIVTGEIQGDLSHALAGLAEYYEDVTDRAVSGATELIQPAVILAVAGLVGFVAVAVVAGIYSTLGAIE